MKKYEFTGETIIFEGRTLHRIRYIRDIGFVCKGEIGGWIEGEHNLSHEGDCRLLQEAKVFGNACIMECSYVINNAIIKDNAQIKGYAEVYGETVIGADTIISGNSRIMGESIISFYSTCKDGESHISGSTIIEGETRIEATGTISHCEMSSVRFFGHLNLKDRTYYKS